MSAAVISVEDFEREANLIKGTIETARISGVDLSLEDTNKVIKAHGKKMQEEGFVFIEMSAFGDLHRDKIAITYLWNEEDNPFDPGSEDWTRWLISHNIKNDTLEKSRQIQIIVNDYDWSDAIFLMNLTEFLDVVRSNNYLDLGLIDGVQHYSYTANPQRGKRTYIYFNRVTGAVENVNWSV